ncbi:MAG: hypothetical protein J5742_02230 [Alphaproteobacteria bacterium]|nr:hypothetical protein [Alphaproteobacteria bacterium]
MDKYTFKTSGTELLELVAIVVNIISGAPWNAEFFFDKKYSLLACRSEILSSRIHSNEEDFVKMANRLVRREPDIIQDAQKIVRLFQNTDDVEGQKVLFNILKGIDKKKIANGVRDYNIQYLYRRFLYNSGSVYKGFRMNNPEINKFLLVRILESERPEEEDFKILSDNAESLQISDEDIEKIYKMLKHKYESDGLDYRGVQYNDNKLQQIKKYFAPIQERINAKKQLSAQQTQSVEVEPQTMEEALAEIRRLRAENNDLKKRIDVLEGIRKTQQLRHPDNRNISVPTERQIETI